jgi:DNA-binding transcriptional LysR family regulator
MPRADPEATVAFVSVIEQGGFREAARSLGVPRSTLSQRVQRLEEQLGVQLLVRGARSVTYTPLGERYYREVLPALLGLWQAEAGVLEGIEHPSGRLRITAPLELGQAMMPAVLSAFAARYPEVELMVDLTDRVVNMVEEGFDLAIRVGNLPDSALTVRRLGRLCALGVFASPRYLEDHAPPTTPELLAEHRCLTMGGHAEPNVWTFTVSGKQKRIFMTPQINVNSFTVLVELAISGLGIARLPVHNAQAAVAQGRLVELLADFAPRPVPCHAVFQGGRNQPKAVRAMLEVLTEHFAGAPLELAPGRRSA